MKDKNEPWGWMLVTKSVNGLGFGIAYMMGTWTECARYQMRHGLRNTTEIV